MKICSIPDCGKKYCANGYCAAHNALYKRHGDPLFKKSRWDGHIKEEKPCQNPSCENKVLKGKFCGKCRQRKHRHGDMQTVKTTGNKEIWKLSRNAGPKHKYTLDTSILDSWTPALAWLLGWSITDGCVEITLSKKKNTRHVLSWHLKDREPLEIFQKLFKTNKPIEETWRTKDGVKRLYYRLRLCGKKLVNRMIELGIEPNKTFKTKIPPMPPEMMPHFLRGVFEGDGTVYINGKRILTEICSGCESFLVEIQKFLGYGSISYREDKDRGYSAYYLCHNKLSMDFLRFIYEQSQDIRLNRKYSIFESRSG
jgi:hypothetical protein